MTKPVYYIDKKSADSLRFMEYTLVKKYELNNSP